MFVDPYGLDVTNNSGHTLWVLGGGTNDGPRGRDGIEAVLSGGTYIGSQDAFITPIGPHAGEVYKTVNFTDVVLELGGEVDLNVRPGTSLYDSARSVIGNLWNGGPVDMDNSNYSGWQDLLDEFCRQNTGAPNCNSCN